MLVFYFFQGEAGESLHTPNAFHLPSPTSSSSVSFGQFLQHFPSSANIHGGRLHFRFRAQDAKLGYVWRDVISPQELLPTFGDKITAKVLCLDPKAIVSRTARLRRKSTVDFGAEGLLAATNVGARRPYSDGGSAPSSSSSSSSANGNGNNRRPQDEDNGIFRTSNSSSSSSNSNSSGGGSEGKGANLLDASGADDMVDFLQAETHPSFASAIDISAAPAVKLNREELAARREAGIQEKVAQALEFKQELDENLKRETGELEAAKAKHDGLLTEWAFDQSKKKRNVRTLLTTMHKVLWSDSTWRPIGLGDVIEPKKVKLQFRKAMLVVHPDRCTALTAENRFVGKRVFEAINEAYQEFLKTESVD